MSTEILTSKEQTSKQVVCWHNCIMQLSSPKLNTKYLYSTFFLIDSCRMPPSSSFCTRKTTRKQTGSVTSLTTTEKQTKQAPQGASEGIAPTSKAEIHKGPRLVRAFPAKGWANAECTWCGGELLFMERCVLHLKGWAGERTLPA